MAEDEIRYTIADAPEPPEDDTPAPAAADIGANEDETAQATHPDAAAGQPTPGDAWREVMTQIDALGDSMSRWMKAAATDPENRRHAAEIKAKLEAVGEKIGEAMDDASRSDIGRSVQEAADKTGRAVVDVSGKVAAEAGPAVSSALTGLAGLLGKAADRVGKAADRPPEGGQASPSAGAETNVSGAPEASGEPGGDEERP